MKIVNIMNFVRTFEPRDAETEKKLWATARDQLRLSEEMKLPSTFLLEYDALCDERYVELFRNVGENIELGFWYEVVEPLTTAIGIPYNSTRGYRWDWNIDPGFAMSYPNGIRERLIDEAMRRFREVFGYYPRTVGSWVLDTYTVNYLTDKYDIDALLICRDQINTDAYTMVGGYFSGGYYPSRNNIFTPGTASMRIGTPVFRLLGSDPIHNYDGKKYLSEKYAAGGVYTLEPACPAGRDPECVDWFFKTYYEGESLGFAYTQVGQENSFASFDLVTPLRMQYEKLLQRGIEFQRVCDTGRLFKEKYSKTPATSVCALDNWDERDLKTVYYSCESYVANILYNEGRVAIRCLYLFDDRIREAYLNSKCTTFDSIHENMPIVDTFYQKGETDGGEGIILDTCAKQFAVSSPKDSVLEINLGSRSITLDEEGITVRGCNMEFAPKMCSTCIECNGQDLHYLYKGHKYALKTEGARVSRTDNVISIKGETVRLIPTRL